MKNAAYYAALEFVEKVDELLMTGRGHFRDSDGQILLTLDEVISAAIQDRWPVSDRESEERNETVELALA